MDSSTVDLVSIFIVFFLNLLILFFSVFVIYKLFKWVFSKIRVIFKESKIDYLGILLPLGISVLIYAVFITNTIKYLGWFLVDNFKYFTNFFVDQDLKEYVNNGEALRLSKYLANWSTSIYKSIENNILSINFAELILFFISWIVLAFFYNLLFSKDQEQRVAFNLDNALKTKYANILKYLILILTGIYFSIASIIAIPSFQFTAEERKNAETPMNFEQELSLYVPTDSIFQKYFVEFKKNDSIPFGTLKGVIEIWNNYVESAVNSFKQNRELAVKKFSLIDQNTTKLKEKLYYKSVLTEWYLENKSRILNELNYKHISIKLIFDLMATLQEDDYSSENNYLQIIQNSILPASDRNSASFTPIPNRPFIGEQWGIFKWIAGWLLKTESIALALITGMFGFGLFGAAISSLIKVKNNAIRQEEDDFFKILIRGLSAAMVIFLAVQGGIVVFTTEGSQVNPYILFFTCFVAAVFSDDVWNWAHKLLHKRLADKTNESKTE